MPECIFCDEPCEEGCEECPSCLKKPFPGMYFDPKTFERAAGLEGDGDLRGAWDLLFEEWQAHTDHDYFDGETADMIRERIDSLLERNPALLEERIELAMDEMAVEANQSGGGFDASITEEAMEMAREAGRPDLELRVLERHIGIQVARIGPIYRETPGLKEKLEELRTQSEEYGGSQ